jgi:hypothetical protein
MPWFYPTTERTPPVAPTENWSSIANLKGGNLPVLNFYLFIYYCDDVLLLTLYFILGHVWI